MKKYNRSVVSIIGMIAFLGISISCFLLDPVPDSDCSQFPVVKVMDYNLIIRVLDRETRLPIKNARFTLDYTKTFLKLTPLQSTPSVLEISSCTNHE